MNYGLLKYFYKYIFFSRTRQKLIFLSIIGLLISTFSLTVLQGVMGGLQNGLVGRSKKVLGQGFFDVSKLSPDALEEFQKQLIEKDIKFVPELELELMVQNENYVSPAILHGLDFSIHVPRFLQHKDHQGIVLGSDLGRDLRTFFGSMLMVTSPGHVEVIFREIPLQSRISVTDFYTSQLPEIDKVHGWVRLGFLQNMIRKRMINKLRVYGEKVDNDLLREYSKNFQSPYISWEEQNSTLVYALGLETKVMMFLFMGASFLIGICITSGFLIFYNKVKIDMASFWILGLSKEKLFKLVYSFGQSLSIIFCLLGVVLGILFLILLDTNHFILMPEHFVERNIPVKLDFIHWVVAFIVPYFVASVFTHLTFRVFKKENYSFISLIRKVG